MQHVTQVIYKKNIVIQGHPTRYTGDLQKEYCYTRSCNTLHRESTKRILLYKVMQHVTQGIYKKNIVIQGHATRYTGNLQKEYCYTRSSNTLHRESTKRILLYKVMQHVTQGIYKKNIVIQGHPTRYTGDLQKENCYTRSSNTLHR